MYINIISDLEEMSVLGLSMQSANIFSVKLVQPFGQLYLTYKYLYIYTVRPKILPEMGCLMA